MELERRSASPPTFHATAAPTPIEVKMREYSLGFSPFTFGPGWVGAVAAHVITVRQEIAFDALFVKEGSAIAVT